MHIGVCIVALGPLADSKRDPFSKYFRMNVYKIFTWRRTVPLLVGCGIAGGSASVLDERRKGRVTVSAAILDRERRRIDGRTSDSHADAGRRTTAASMGSVSSTSSTAAGTSERAAGISKGDDNHGTLPSNLTLKCVLVFFRHGARTPLRHVPGLEEVL